MNKHTHDLISIIIPVFNADKYLHGCINSIIGQTYSNFEIVLVDDGSTDQSFDICKYYADKYNNINLIGLRGSTLGASDARNLGLKIAKGELITFIDSDDLIPPNYLKTLVDTLNRYGSKMSMCSYNKVYENDIIDYSLVSDVNLQYKLLSSEEVMNMVLEDQTLTACWGKLYSKELFKHISFPTERYNEDMFVVPELIKEAGQIAFVPTGLYYYNQISQSLVREKFNYKKLDMIDAKLFWVSFVQEFFPKLTNKTSANYYSTVFTLCQFLVTDKSNRGKAILSNYQQELLLNYRFILLNAYISLSNKIKMLLIIFGLFNTVFSSIINLKLKKYSHGF